MWVDVAGYWIKTIFVAYKIWARWCDWRQDRWRLVLRSFGQRGRKWPGENTLAIQSPLERHGHLAPPISVARSGPLWPERVDALFFNK